MEVAMLGGKKWGRCNAYTKVGCGDDKSGLVGNEEGLLGCESDIFDAVLLSLVNILVYCDYTAMYE